MYRDKLLTTIIIIIKLVYEEVVQRIGKQVFIKFISRIKSFKSSNSISLDSTPDGSHFSYFFAPSDSVRVYTTACASYMYLYKY